MGNLPEPWFRKALASGLQRLVALALPGAPPAETIKLTAATWSDFLWGCGIAWDEALDAPRISAAFAALGLRIDRWPAPVNLLQHMKARPEPIALPEADLTPAQRERINHYVDLTREMLAMPKKSVSK